MYSSLRKHAAPPSSLHTPLRALTVAMCQAFALAPLAWMPSHALSQAAAPAPVVKKARRPQPQAAAVAPKALSASVTEIPCATTNGSNCQVRVVATGVGNDKYGNFPSPNPLGHAFTDAQALVAGGDVGAIDFLTQGADGGDASPRNHGDFGGHGGAGGSIAADAGDTPGVVIGSNVSLTGANKGGVVSLVSQGGSGGKGTGANVGTNGVGGPGGGAGSVTVTMDGTLSSTDASTPGLRAVSAAGTGGSGNPAGEGLAMAPVAGVGGNSGVVVVHVGGTIGTAGTGVLAAGQGGDGGQGADHAADPYVAQAGKGGDGGQSAQTVSASVSGSVTSSQAGAVEARAEGGAGGSGGTAITGGQSTTGNGGNGGSGGSGGTAGGTLSGLVSGHTTGMLVAADGGRGGDGGNGSGGAAGIGGQGGSGGRAGASRIDATAMAAASGDTVAISASARGGNGGKGGDGQGFSGQGGSGGRGGDGGTATVDFAGTAGSATVGAAAMGLSASANGGDGGAGSGAGAVGSNAGSGGNGGAGGVALAILRSGAKVTTTGADQPKTSTTVVAGVQAQANGGVGGAGGLGIGLSARGGGSGSGGRGGTATVALAGDVSTSGSFAYGALAQSAGGNGSTAGGTLAMFASHGGVAQNGGAGGTAIALGLGGSVRTTGTGAAGVVAQSVGGGGGVGGNAIDLGVSIVGLGGNGGAGGDGGTVKVGLIDGDSSTDVFGSSIVTNGGQAIGLLAQSVGGGGGNGGNAVQAGPTPLTLTIGGDARGGGNGGQVTVNSQSLIETHGDKSGGIAAQSVAGGGGNGGAGVSADGFGVVTLNLAMGGSGGSGGTGGAVRLSSNQQVVTHGSDSYGIKAQSIAGGGGEGGTSTAIAASISGSNPEVPSVSLAVAVGGSGGVGGTAGSVDLANNGFVSTAGHGAYGVFAQSVAGGGGNGGDSSAASYTNGAGPKISISVGAQGNGGAGGTGGAVTVTNAALVTTGGESAHGVLAQSIGGGGGTGGAGDVAADTSDDGAFGFAGSLTVGGQGGTGSQGGLVTVGNQAGIATSGEGARGIMAQSVGGGGGTAGGGVAKANGRNLSLAVSVGGNGGTGGHGGEVHVTNQGSIVTTNADADAIYAQSVGGGGGSAGKGSSTAGGTNSGAEVAEAMVKRLSNGLNIGLAVVDKGDKLFQIGDGVNKDVKAINDLRKAVSSADEPASAGVASAAAAPGAGADPAPDTKKDGEATNIDIGLTIGGKGGAGGTGGLVQATNAGDVATDGSRSNGIFAQSVGGGGGVGGVTTFSAGTDDKGASVSVGGSGQSGNTGGAVVVDNHANATITTLGSASHGIHAQSIGGGGGKGGLTGSEQGALGLLNVVIGGWGGTGGHGGTVTVTNAGTVTASGAQAFGIFAQSTGGGGGTADILTDGKAGDPNKVAALTLDIGGVGGTGGDGGAVQVNLASGSLISTSGTDGVGAVAQSVGGGGGAFITSSILNGAAIGLGGLTIPVHVGGAGGSTGNGGTVTVAASNAGVKTTAANAHGILAQSIGGGGGLITGTATPGTDMQTLFSSDLQKGDGGAVGVTLDSGAYILTFGAGAAGVLAQSVGGGGGMFGSLSQVDIAAAMRTPTITQGGQGGDVTVRLATGGNIWTLGTRAHGIVAQSFGGGGGMTAQADGNGFVFSAATPYTGCSGTACTGAVNVEVAPNALVRAQGAQAYAVVAQSRGNGVNDATVTIDQGGRIQAWKDAAGAIFMGGAGTNTVNNSGTIDIGTAADQTLSTAGVAITGNQPITVNNSGAISGSQILDGSGGTPSKSALLAATAAASASVGQGTLNNLAGGTVNAGSEIRLGGGTLHNAGTLEIGGSGFAQTHVQGDLQQPASGHLFVDIDTLGGKADTIVVDGSAQLAGTIHVRPTTLSPHSVAVVQAAGGLTLDPATTAIDTGGGRLFGYQLDSQGSGGMTLTPYSRLGSAEVQQQLGSRRGDLASYLHAGFNGGVSEAQSKVYAALSTVAAWSDVAGVFDALASEAMQSAAITRLTGSLQFSDRMNTVRCDARNTLGEMPHEAECSWARVADARTTRAATSAESGFALDSASVQGGFQRRIAPDWFVGAALSYDNGNLRARALDQRVSGNGGSAGAVLKYEAGPWMLSGALDFGYSRHDSTRNISFGAINETAKARFGVWHAGLHARAAYAIPLGVHYLRPYVDVHAVRLRTDGYKETGAGALNLRADASSNTYLSVSPMVEMGTVQDLAHGLQLRSFVAIGASLHGNASASSQAHLAGWGNAGGSGFTTTSSVPKRRAKLELGGTLVLRKDSELSFSYGGEFASGYRSHSGQLQYRYLFN